MIESTPALRAHSIPKLLLQYPERILLRDKKRQKEQQKLEILCKTEIPGGNWKMKFFSSYALSLAQRLTKGNKY